MILYVCSYVVRTPYLMLRKLAPSWKNQPL